MTAATTAALDPQTGQTIEVRITEFIRSRNQLASASLHGEVLATSNKALLVRAHAVVRESQWCLRCGLDIDNPISRLVGYGPICSEKLGIPRPEKLDPKTIDDIRKRVEKETLWEGWLPRSQTTILSVTGTPAPKQTSTAGRVVDHNGSSFILRFPYDADLVGRVKAVLPGARWNKDFKVWTVPTSELDKVGKFAVRHQFSLTEAAEAIIAGLSALIEASNAATSDFQVEGLGMALYPFQRAGVEYAVRQKQIILGDQMGLGKTPSSLAAVHYLKAYPCVVVCPASVKLNWEREIRRWLPPGVSAATEVLGGTSGSLLSSQKIVILNYDILSDWLSSLKHFSPRSLILDESHATKNPKAQRTQAALSLSRHVRTSHGADALVLCLTGTAILNRPEELVTQLDILGRLEEFGGGKVFKNRYKFAGPSRLQELNRRLRGSCYVRREKADVLAELPPKIRSVIPVELDNRKEYLYARDDLISYLRQKATEDEKFLAEIKHLPPTERREKLSERAQSVEERALRAEVLVRINALKRLVAKGKLAAIKSWVSDFLSDSDEKLVIFAWHQDVVAELAKQFNADSITGATPIHLRQHYVDLFQTDKKHRVIVCNMQAGGVGITLTAASNVCFTELGWTPALHDQAEDRCIVEGQRVLTRDKGLTPIEQVTKYQQVLTHAGNWKLVLATKRREHRGLLTRIEYKRYSQPLLCTHDHKLLVKKGDMEPEWLPASSVLPGDYLVTPRSGGHRIEVVDIPVSARIPETFINNWGTEQRNGRALHLPEQVSLTPDLLYLFGWYLAEGCTVTGTDKGRFVSLSGHEKERSTLEEQAAVLAKFNITSTIYAKTGQRGIELRAYSAELARWFSAWFGSGAETKHLPPELLDLEAEQAAVLLKGYIDGDGYCRNKQVEWVTVSPVLAAQINLLAIRCGYSTTLRRVSSGKNAGQWIGGYTENGNPSRQALNMADDKYVYQPVSWVETYYAPKRPTLTHVYDLTVADDHSFVVGQIAVHNCHRIGQRDSVTAWYLLGAGTVEEDIAALLDQKRVAVEATLIGNEAAVTESLLAELKSKLLEVAA